MASTLKSLALRYLPEFALKPLRRSHYRRVFESFSMDEEPDLKVVRYLVNDGDTVLDIGANIGVYTKFLSQFVGSSGKVISFEPIPFTFGVLKHNVESSGLSNIQLHCVALSNEAGKATMSIPVEAASGTSYYQASLGSSKKGKTEQVDVEISRIDDLVSANPSFVKCDVEGHELPCFHGSSEMLARSKPALLVEVSGNLDDSDNDSYTLFQELASQGYRAFWRDGDTLREHARGDRSINYFFLQDEQIAMLQSSPLNIVTATD